jgi:hypothetical protein
VYAGAARGLTAQPYSQAQMHLLFVVSKHTGRPAAPRARARWFSSKEPQQE